MLALLILGFVAYHELNKTKQTPIITEQSPTDVDIIPQDDGTDFFGDIIPPKKYPPQDEICTCHHA